MSEWYRPSREKRKTPNGQKHFFILDNMEFEVEWHVGENSDDNSTWIRPSQEDGIQTGAPEWFPNYWPRFKEIVEPETAHWILNAIKTEYERGVKVGRAQKTREIKKVLHIT